MRVLETLHQPVDHRGHHLHVDVVAQLAAADSLLDEVEGSVRILAHEEPVDVALELRSVP